MNKRIALQHAALFWRDNLTRGLLSVVGVVVGISGLIVASAIDRGAEAELIEVAKHSGTGLVQAATDGGFGSDIAAHLSATLSPRVHGAAAYAVSNRSVAYRDRSLPVQVIEVEPDYQRAKWLEVSDGRFVATFDVERHARVVAINETLAHTLLPFASKLNSQIQFDTGWYQVVGVVADGLGAPVAYTPLQNRDPQKVVVGFVSEEVMRTSLRELQRALEVRVTGSVRPVEIEVAVDAIREQQQVRRLVGNVLTVLAILVLWLGGLGVANVMLLNVLTRIREIALRRALGARACDIVLQFSAETSLVCGIGGVIALACAPFYSLVFMSMLGWPMRIDLYGVSVALAATVLVAAAASVVPARRAAAVPPAQGLA